MPEVNDMEMGQVKEPLRESLSSNQSPPKPPAEHEKGFVGRVVESFRRNPDPEARVLEQKLKSRHVKMIAIGGSIGTGLFIGTGAALSTGGPASLLIAFLLIGINLYCTTQSLGELVCKFPVSGSFAIYSSRFIDPAWGFAMGWNYALQWLVVLPLEIIAASITINFWDTGGKYDHAIFVTVFLIVIMMLNLYGVQAYGETEFWLSSVKVIAVVGFIIFGIITNCGGGPLSSHIGGKYWESPGAFNNGFKGLCSVFVVAAFSFAGTELIGLTVAECPNPRKKMPTAIKQVFWRILLFYVTSIIIIGVLVPYNDTRLLKEGSGGGVAMSPFVIAIRDSGVRGLDSVFNAVILLAILSVANASVFGSSRVLLALSEHGQAPKVLSYIDQRGRPMVAMLIAFSIGLLGYTADATAQQMVLDWMLAISGLSSIFTWGSINLAHIRFRGAWAKTGHSLEELPFRSTVGIVGSWVGLAFNILVLIAQFWVGVWPVGYGHVNQVQHFFQKFLAVPVVLVFFICWKLYKRTKIVRTIDMDIDSNGQDFDWEVEKDRDTAEREKWPKWYKVFKFCC